MTQEQISLVEENRQLIDLVINHNYQVQRSNDTVSKLMDLAKELNDNQECSTCQHVIQDAFRLVWKEYKEAVGLKKKK